MTGLRLFRVFQGTKGSKRAPLKTCCSPKGLKKVNPLPLIDESGMVNTVDSD